MVEFECNERIIKCTKEEYVLAKTRDLQEFGYSSVTKAQVKKQLENFLAGKPLDVIGRFIEGDNPKEI